MSYCVLFFIGVNKNALSFQAVVIRSCENILAVIKKHKLTQLMLVFTSLFERQSSAFM